MERTINETGFWKERIKKADQSKHEHHSVYLCNPIMWRDIAKVHQGIVQKVTKGKVLDAGCGYGRSSEWFGKDYVGVDFSPDFIAMAQAKYPEKEFMVASLDKLPFKDKEFDWAICVSIRHMVIHYTGAESWKPMEKELQRVAKNILFLEYTNPEKYEIL